MAHSAAMSGQKLEAPDGHHQYKKIEASWLTRTQGVLSSKYVLCLTMYRIVMPKVPEWTSIWLSGFFDTHGTPGAHQ